MLFMSLLLIQITVAVLIGIVVQAIKSKLSASSAKKPHPKTMIEIKKAS